MGNVLEARVTIKGTRPIMWHAFGPDSIPLEKQERTGVAGNDPAEWRRTVLATRAGQLYVRGDYVFGALRDGARHTKRGRGSIQKFVQATLQVADDRVLLDRFVPGATDGMYNPLTAPEPPRDPEEPVYLDVRSCVNPGTKFRNVRYRVSAAPGWTCAFTLQWDPTVVSRGEMEAVTIDAGRLVGLGDGRNIGMGRFTVESFDVQAIG
jgi:hypothetical protein